MEPSLIWFIGGQASERQTWLDLEQNSPALQSSFTRQPGDQVERVLIFHLMLFNAFYRLVISYLRLKWGVQQLTVGKVGSSGLSLSRQEKVVFAIEKIFFTEKMIYSCVEKLVPNSAQWHNLPLALALPG